MPDITMCRMVVLELDCPYKETCYRFKAAPSTYQSFFTVQPIGLGGMCDDYWPIDNIVSAKQKYRKRKINYVKCINLRG